MTAPRPSQLLVFLRTSSRRVKSQSRPTKGVSAVMPGTSNSSGLSMMSACLNGTNLPLESSFVRPAVLCLRTELLCPAALWLSRKLKSSNRVELVAATEFGRGITREEVQCMWCCGRGLFGAGGVLGSVMSVLGKASSGRGVRLSLVGPGWRSSLAWPITPAPPPGPSSLVRRSLKGLRSSFSEELVLVAMIPLSLLPRVEVGL